MWRHTATTLTEEPSCPSQPLMCAVILCSNLKVSLILQPCHPLCGRCGLGHLDACLDTIAVPKYTETVPKTSFQVVPGMDGELCTSMTCLCSHTSDELGLFGELCLDLSPELWCENTISGWREMRDKEGEQVDKNRPGTGTRG